MKFEALPIAGAMKVSIERHTDHRGFFARTFCIDEFATNGLPTAVVQSSISYNAKAGTVRGMHFQWLPSTEDKLVRCIRGAIYDVLLDLRPESSSYLQHIGVRLDDQNRDAVMIPHGVAHGFQTVADDTEVFYQMTDRFAPELASGVRWNDPAFGIKWPLSHITIAPRDAGYPDFDREEFECDVLRHRSRAR